MVSSLVPMLVVRAFNDVYNPSTGKLRMIETKNTALVETIAFNVCFERLEVMCEHKNFGIKNYPII